MSIEQIKQRTRKREIVEARHIAQVLIIKFTKTSTIKAGEYTGGYDHSTVLHAQRTVSTIPSLNRKYKRIEKQLKEKHNAIN
jgi:chromosomal replication initiator protein